MPNGHDVSTGDVAMAEADRLRKEVEELRGRVDAMERRMGQLEGRIRDQRLADLSSQ